MTSQTQLQSDFERYLSTFPQERDRLAMFSEFISRFSGAELYDRKNFTGHITASGMVYKPSSGKLLLLEHVQLKK